jgi:DNA-binding CsgD family transcriptional regulator
MARDVGSAPVGQGPAALERWPLVGRLSERAQLKTSIANRRGAVITGPAGVGKTVLATLGLEFGRERRMSVALGALLYAAEALGESAVHLRRDGASRDAAATQQTAARLLARCEGAVTPFGRAIGARAQLTPAELDTALQAATGSTDKQIAEMVHLSARTVENRLHRAYQKLGISHRRELAEALRDLPGV